ncbi:DUF433 domain-containing protein [Spirulina sp. 06S082]|uniref:DUF433 domain-containing protein n=1 Tax=Spirulina sp. 06S082 TaxID=3110248 RepID=UPI002B20DB9A|nr:DUF433 domain-containing protein [Spirulina sp. 06S082]MEA5469686.1 DUF433 domain-containing protein [Spirulina sp. 06S082]
MTAYPLKLPDRLHEEAAQYAETQGISLEQFIIGAIAEKVGMFRQPADDPAFPQIAYRKGSSGQYTPILKGTGIRVQTIVIARNHWKFSPSQIATEYNLQNTQVAEALRFYLLHTEEIDRAIAIEEVFESNCV